MTKIQDFQQKITTLIAQQQFLGKPVELYEPINYTMSQSGKRLRPLLTLLACDLFGGDIEKALYPALAVEVFHNFTLVHDDIMDKAPLRRGKETVYQKWNSDIAILSGDTMFAMAYQYALQTDTDLVQGILKVFSKAAIEVCEGQQLDMNFESQQDVSIDDYLEMIKLKTAVLLGASLEIGAVVAKAKPEAIDQIYRFGIAMGLAFQLKDDVLDVYGKQEDFGKISGGDIATNKKTYLYLKALELADATDRQTLLDLYSTTEKDSTRKIKQVKAIFAKYQVQEITSLLMEEYYLEALSLLSSIEADEAKKASLTEFATYLYERNH